MNHTKHFGESRFYSVNGFIARIVYFENDILISTGKRIATEMEFDDWEVVQTAMSHYSYEGSRSTNDALSRLGEKALRFVLLTEMRQLDPQNSKQTWFLTTNVRFMTRFQFLATYIESSLRLSPITRYSAPTNNPKMNFFVEGQELVQFQHSVISKSILALIGVIYSTKGEEVTRNFIRTLFIDPYKDETGKFIAPVLQPLQVKQTGGL